MGIRQLGWSSERRGIQWSNTPFYRRFSIIRTTSGYTVNDHEAKDTERVTTLAAARAWAGIRIGEQDVRHGGIHD